MNPAPLKDSPDIHALLQELDQFQSVQRELDRRIFNLKTLYDVSKDIFSSVDSEAILRNFLLMVMGNFGAAEGMVMLFKSQDLATEQSAAVGIHEDTQAILQQHLQQVLTENHGR